MIMIDGILKFKIILTIMQLIMSLSERKLSKALDLEGIEIEKLK